MLNRLRNLWNISSIETPKGKPLSERLKLTLQGKRMATIIELDDTPDMFPDHVETVE